MEHVAFDPSRYLTKVKGNDYLEVKWRLVWLRDTNPDAVIDTELVSHVGNQAIFRARVALPSGASATGWGSEEISGFVNYIEKAETKAIGRALAALGFGTQFTEEFDYGAENGQVVDAPVDRRSFQQPTALFTREETQDHPPSPKQAGFIQAISRDLRMNAQGLNELTQRLVGRDADQLTRRDASTVIEALKEQQQARAAQRAS